ncbi:MAG: flagellar FliJ family protein [Chloroflexi bacterium]|nr:flagellar FliJ family protein [Chloroflexota bacterium]
MAHRERLERVQVQALGRELQREQTRREALLSVQGEREAFFAAGAPANGPLEPGELVAAAAYALRMEREIGARAAALAHSGAAVAVERGLLMERRRDLRAVETLLEKRVAAERDAARRQEMHRLDELAGQRWIAAAGDNADRA